MERSYNDLGGIQEIVVRFVSSHVVVYVLGPDGPDYYGAVLRIDRDGTVHRRLEQGIDGSVENKTFPAGRPRRPS